ncbi:hypothetical protein H4I96_08812 [Botrytis cinerea]
MSGVGEPIPEDIPVEPLPIYHPSPPYRTSPTSYTPGMYHLPTLLLQPTPPATAAGTKTPGPSPISASDSNLLMKSGMDGCCSKHNTQTSTRTCNRGCSSILFYPSPSKSHDSRSHPQGTTLVV